MWFAKIVTLKGQGHRQKWHYQIPWPKNIDLDAKIIVISALVQKLWSKTSFCIMVANVTRSCMSHIQTVQDIFILLKGPAPSYLVLKFDHILPFNNWVVAQSVILQRSWPWKVKVIGQKNSTIRFLDRKNRSRHQNCNPKCFSSKVMVKDIFLHNGGQRNVFAYVTRSNRPR